MLYKVRSLLVLGLLSIHAFQASAQEASRPNVLFLFSDDQQADAIGAYGNPQVRTPHIDRLVQSGFSFRRCYCMGSMSGAVCLPSRAMLMSGRTLFRTPTDLEGVATLPETFRRAGYETFGTGKWHNGQDSFARSFERGRNVFFGGMSDHYRVPIVNLQAEGKYSRKELGEKHSSELFAEAALEFLRTRDARRPFFAYVAFTAPHDPRTPPEEYLAMYPPERIELPPSYLPVHPFDNGEMVIRDERLAPWPRTKKVVQEHIAAYCAMITHMDAQIGRILAALLASGQYQNTIIVFSSDQGLALGRHGLMGKQNLYEHSTRAPLVFCGPGVNRGASETLCYLLDVFPTLCQLAGLAIPKSVEGRPLQPILRGESVQGRESLLLVYKNVQRALRTPLWKLIRYPQINRTQLFDMVSDPHELHDLSTDPAQAARIDELMAQLAEMQAKAGDEQPLSSKNPRPDRFDPPEVAKKKR